MYLIIMEYPLLKLYTAGVVVAIFGLYQCVEQDNINIYLQHYLIHFSIYHQTGELLGQNIMFIIHIHLNINPIQFTLIWKNKLFYVIFTQLFITCYKIYNLPLSYSSYIFNNM